MRNGKIIGTLSVGDFFGEVALIQGSRRTATVRALTPCEVTVFAREDFDALSVGSSQLAKAIQAQAKERVKPRRKSLREA